MQSLNKLIQSIPRTERQVVTIMTDVIRGLDYLHKHGIMHLDMKISNIVSVAGVSKIIDFSGVNNIHNPALDFYFTENYRPPGMCNSLC